MQRKKYETIKSIRIGIVLAMVSVMIFSCQKEDYSNIDGDNSQNYQALAKEGKGKDSNNGKGKGKGKKDETPPDTTVQDSFTKTYILSDRDDPDALYKFSISKSGKLILLESDPTVGLWGSDFYGLWSDPFTYSDNQVNYIKGLTNTTYDFDYLENNKVDVVKTLLVASYLSNSVDTTITHPGVYQLQ
jgi:hypothetical protein